MFTEMTPTQNTKLAIGSFDLATFDQFKAVAEYFMASEATPKGIKNAPQLVMIMQAGKDLGLTVTESMQSLCIINGVITMYGPKVIARVKEHGYKVERLETTSKIAKVKISNDKDPEGHTEEYTIEMAKHAGLT